MFIITTVAHADSLVMTIEPSIESAQSTLWNVKAMPYFRETLILFCRVFGYNKLNKCNKGNLVFADELERHPLLREFKMNANGLQYDDQLVAWITWQSDLKTYLHAIDFCLVSSQCPPYDIVRYSGLHWLTVLCMNGRRATGWTLLKLKAVTPGTMILRGA